jgi:hypothetical protein
MKALSAIVFLGLASLLQAQNGSGPKPSATSLKYHEYRYEVTEPSYGLSKVKRLIRGIKTDQEDNQRMSDKLYNSLSNAEKFTYAMLHGEDASQNCSDMPGIVDEQKKIFAYSPNIFDDNAMWSERQRNFLHNHRSSVIGWLHSTMRSKRRVGLNLKSTIIELNATELIPDMVRIYQRDHKDHDILTAFMHLMKENKYRPFVSSSIYKRLYGPDTNYEGYLPATTALQNQIIAWATGLSKSRR